MIFLLLSQCLEEVIPKLFIFLLISSMQSLLLCIITFSTHYYLSSPAYYLHVKVNISYFSKFLFIDSSAGKEAQATSLATFFILWSGSRTKNTDSVTIKYMSTTFLLFFIYSTDWFILDNGILSSQQRNTPHLELDIHMLMSYCNPR